MRGIMKKKYVKPEMEVMTMGMGMQILSASGDQWWVPPEEKEGCDTPWWCKEQ